MKVIETRGNTDLATVYIAQLDDGELIEFVESLQPPIPRCKKWVLIVSTLRGCPVNCSICDAGLHYAGKLSAEEIFRQIDYLVDKHYPNRKVPIPKFKIQFARMGDPAFNPAVLTVLKELPRRYDAPGLLPSISTIAPNKTDDFFAELIDIKNELYTDGRFQMQFSLHTTSPKARRELVPANTWTFEKMSRWGERFYQKGDRKISLNFAPIKGYPLEIGVIADTFSTEYFMIKLTPVNPTQSSVEKSLEGVIDPDDPKSADELIDTFRKAGFDTLLSIGETRENQIGSNCGMHARTWMKTPCS